LDISKKHLSLCYKSFITKTRNLNRLTNGEVVMKKLVIVYFKEQAIVSSTAEAEAFINQLVANPNHGKGNLICTNDCKTFFNNYFEKGIVPDRLKTNKYYLNPGNSGNTFVAVYIALADTLEEHNAIYNEQKEADLKDEAELEYGS